MTSAISRLVIRHRSLNWVLLDQAMVSGVNFLTTIVLARLLGIEEFGVFALAWMVVLFVSGVQFALIISPMNSIGPKQSADHDHHYSAALYVHQIAFSGLAFAVVLACGHLAGSFNPDWDFSSIALATAATGIAFTSQDFVRRYYFTRDQGRAAFTNDAISYLGQLAVLFGLFQLSSISSETALWAICATSTFAVVCGLSGLKHPAWAWGSFLETTARHWHFGKWLFASSIIHWAAGNAFIVAAGALLGTSAVGAVHAAQRIMGVTHVYMQALTNLIPMRAARNFDQHGTAALRRVLVKTGFTGGVVTVSIAIAAALAPEFWLTLIYGGEFAAYAEVLQWYAAIYVVIFITFVLRIGLRAIEHTRPVTVAYALMAVFALPAAYPLVEWFELRGVMFGILITQLIILLTLAVALRRSLARLDTAPPPTNDSGGQAQ